MPASLTFFSLLVAAAVAAQDEPAAADSSYYVQGTGNGIVHVSSPTGILPGFLPVPIPANGGSFTYRVVVAVKSESSQDISICVAPADPPHDLAPTATFKVTVLAGGRCRLEAGDAVAAPATLRAELNAGGGSFRCGEPIEALAFAFALPSGDEVQLQTLSIQTHDGAVETVVSTPAAAAPVPQDQPPDLPPVAPEPLTAALPFDLIALASVADIGTGDAVWGYGLGIALRLDPYDAVHAHVILRWRCFSTSFLEEFETGGDETGLIQVGADDESPLPDPGEGEGGGSSISTLRTRVRFCLFDVGLSFDIAMASWIWLNVQFTAGFVQGDTRGDRFVQTAGVGLSAPIAGGIFSVGWSATFTRDNLTVDGAEPLGTIGAWTAAWQVRF